MLVDDAGRLIYQPDTSVYYVKYDGKYFTFVPPINLFFVTYMDYLFTVVAFEKVYQQDAPVGKIIDDVGYHLTMQIDLWGFQYLVYYAMNGEPSDNEFAQIKANYQEQLKNLPTELEGVDSYTVSVYFDNDDNITTAIVNFDFVQPQTINDDVEFYHNLIEFKVALTDEEIVAPEWLANFYSPEV